MSDANFTPNLGEYKSLQPFRFWCQKVLPLVYDDSLSYYELLCKVVDYLNKTMEDVETLHGDVTNLHKAYVELQGYVNNYFNNLDVQNEINNKLDSMASDGSLKKLLEPYFDNFTKYTKEQLTEMSSYISTLETRMSEFEKLGEGSTTGDAELIDIRTNYNGTVYTNAGDAVRAQGKAFNNLIAGIYNDGKETSLLPLMFNNFEAKTYVNGILTDSDAYYITKDYVPRTIVKALAPSAGYTLVVYTFDKDLKYLGAIAFESYAKLEQLTGSGAIKIAIHNTNYTHFELTQELLSSQSVYVNNPLIKTFDTVQQAITYPHDIKYFNTLGYNAVGDGGAGTFYVSDTEVFPCIKMNNGKFAVYMTDYAINVRCFGVLPSLVKCEVPLQALIDQSNDKTKYGLYFPKGQYNFTGGIKLKNRLDIFGDWLTYGEKDRTLNGSRLYFTVPSNTTCIDGTDNTKFSVHDLYVYSTAITITEDRSQISTGDAGKSVFSVQYNNTGVVGISLPDYGCSVDRVSIRGFSYGINGGTFNNFNEVYFWECVNSLTIVSDCLVSNMHCFSVMQVLLINGANNSLINIRADSVGEYGIVIIGGSNVLTNINLDYVQYAAIWIRGGDYNIINGLVSRCGTYWNNCDADTITLGNFPQACYVYLSNGANYNRVTLNGQKRNPLDVTSEYSVPFRTIVGNNGNNGNHFIVNGNIPVVTNNDGKLSLIALYNLYTVMSSNDTAIIEYYNSTYYLKQAPPAYQLNSVYYHNLIGMN